MRAITISLCAAASAALSACGPTLLETHQMTSVLGGAAWAEIRVVTHDGVNETAELWGFNRSDQRVCVGFSAYQGHLNVYDLPAGTSRKLGDLGGGGGDYRTNIATEVGDAACSVGWFVDKMGR